MSLRDHSDRRRARRAATTGCAALLAITTACERPTSPSAVDLLLHDTSLSVLGGPLPMLTQRQRHLFDRGNAVFQTVFTPATGLGPTFNDVACSQCHQNPIVGATGEDIETHATAFQGGVCSELSNEGGPVIQDSVTPALRAALGITKEPLPPHATGVGRRTTPLVLGFGLLDAVPVEEILSHADPDDRDHDGVRGHPNLLPDGRIGRFGRKANVATLREFVAGAFTAEMGITDPESPTEENIGGIPIPPGVETTNQPELSQSDLDATNVFMQLLAPPPPLKLTEAGERGRRLFATIGCATCHLPALRTGYHAMRALRNKEVHAYTDLLLHDMGPDLADICRIATTPSEFRTEPLMGLHLKIQAGTALLHDGRAPTVDQAIQLHGGEAAGARDRFLALTPAERATLLLFVQSL